MHHFHDCLHVLNGRMLQDPVSEIEDMTGSAVGPTQNIEHAGLELREGRKEGDGIEIPLNSDVLPEQGPTIIERDAPVQADHITARLFHQRQKGRCIRPKMDDWHARSSCRRQNFS